MEGWIKLHRCIEEWKRVNDLPTLRLWLYILDHARHEDGNWNGVPLKAGQLVIGRKSFFSETGITEQTYRTSLRRLKDDGTITTEATNKYTIVTVENWGFYQRGEEKSTSISTSVSTSNQPATNQQPTTNKNVKNGIMKKVVVAPPTPSKGETPDGGAGGVVEGLIRCCLKVPSIIDNKDDPTIRSYLKRFLGWGMAPEEIMAAIKLVGHVNGGKTSLVRIVNAMRTGSTKELKPWELEAWRKYIIE